MPITIKSASMKYRSPSSGNYVDVNAISDTTTDIIAPNYSDLTFPVAAGQHCIYEGDYYESNQIISISEAWTPAHWSQLTVGEEFEDVKSALNQKYEKPASGIPASDLASGVIPSVPVQDVQVNGTSVLSQGVANVPLAGPTDKGVVGVYYESYGVKMDGGILKTVKASDAEEKAGTNNYHQVVPSNQHGSVFYGLAKAAGDSTQSASSNAVGTYTESAKSAISDMLNAPETVSGTTPTITAKAGVRYVCGECSTLDITAPASGDIEVIFDSGSTPTVLTVTPPTGVTAVKWANGFDPTSLDADTRYDLIITDGEWGLAASWAV